MRRILPVFVALSAALAACGPSMGAQSPTRPPLATQWFDRAKTSYRAADFDDARDAVRHAIGAAPNDADIRVLSARIALVRLDFAEALKLTEGLDSSDAHGIRGRAYWFTGDLEHAADELEAMLDRPAGERRVGARRCGPCAQRRGAPPVRDGGGPRRRGGDAAPARPRAARRSRRGAVRARRRAHPGARRDRIERGAHRLEQPPRGRVGRPAGSIASR